ncbi:hypothetical protein ACWD04_31960 [Streptomyces sp. NPDC002911]
MSEASRAVAGRIRDGGLARAVETLVADVLALDDAGKWADELAYGRSHVVGGRLLWVRTVLGAVVPVAEQPTRQPVREYDVRFSSTAAGSEQSRHFTRGSELVLLTAVNVASAVASTLVVGAPTLVNEVTSSRSEAVRQTVITGRKLFVDGSTAFTAGVDFRFFVDGVELGEDALRSGSTVDRRLGVDFPAVYSGPGEPKVGQDAGPVQGDRPADRSRPSRAGEVLNAIDMTPLIANLQARLRAAGLDAGDTGRVVREAQILLNERTARNRSRWWLTSGDSTNAISVGTDRLGTAGFRGVLRIRISAQSLQLIGLTDGVKTREDFGLGLSGTLGRGGESLAALSYGLNATGLVDPSLQHGGHDSEAKGMAPVLTATISTSRGWTHRLASQPLTHTILNATDAQARYRAVLAVDLIWRSRTHPVLETGAPPVEVGAEFGVPWRDGRGAAGFEQHLLGSVHSPAVRGTGGAGPQEGLRTLPGPVPSQPHVRALLRESGLDAVRAVVRPPRLDPGRRPRRHEREPMALASRRGLGYAVAAALPGAELVEDSFRTRLAELVRERRVGALDRADVDRQLSVFFGRPALEGDLADLLMGVRHTVDAGSLRVTMAVRAHLLDSSEVTDRAMTVNTRAAVSEAVTGGTDSQWSLQAGIGGAARLTMGPWGRFQLGSFRLTGRLGAGSAESFARTSKSYRRKENTESVDEHVLDIAYEMSQYVEGDPKNRVEEWWIERPGDLVAQIVVPQEHAPARPVAEEEARSAGALARVSRRWPAGEPAFDLATGTAGLYPAFPALPVLARTIAGLYARLHGLSGPVARHPVHWPSQIVRMTSPSALTAYFGMLTGEHGRTVDLPGVDGWHTTVRLRLRGYSPRELPAGGDTEIEQYTQDVGRFGHDRDRRFAAGVLAAAGPVLRFGSDSGGEAGGGDAEHGVAEGPGGRAVAQVMAEARKNWGRNQERERGFIDITRATYAGRPASYRADAVFEISISKSRKGRVVEERPRYLRFTDAMELLAPGRRAEDILPRGADGITGLGDRPAPEGAPARTYLFDGVIPGTSAHPEVLHADGVLDAITGRLEKRGILRPPRQDGAVGTDPLRRSLEAAFRSDALITKVRSLLGNGFWLWLPAEGFGGSTKYLWIRVSVTGVDRARSDRHRPEVKLTLRGESVEEKKHAAKQGHTFSTGAVFTARGGEQTQDNHHHGHGHGGADYSTGRSRTRSTAATELTKTVSIIRANTRDREGSHEFEHRLAFRIEMGGARKLPRLFDTASQAAHLLGGLVARAVHRSDQWGRFRHEHQAWTWYDDGLGRPVDGSVRLLVPRHLTREAPPGEEAPAPFRRQYGRNARWVQENEVVTPLPEALVENLHPWDMPAADAVNRWARVAALRGRHVPEPDTARELFSGRPDFTSTDGLAYEHFTSHNLLRPEIGALLRGRYEVTVDGRVLEVGLELTGAEELGPQSGIQFKARRYRQADEDGETSSERQDGTHHGGGPEGGGGSDGYAMTGRSPLEFKWSGGQKYTSAMSETLEHNREGVREFRYFRFDTTVVARPADGVTSRVLKVDVPGGLIGMLPLDEGRLADGLDTYLAALLGTGSQDIRVRATEEPVQDRPGEDHSQGRSERAAVARGTSGGVPGPDSIAPNPLPSALRGPLEPVPELPEPQELPLRAYEPGDQDIPGGTRLPIRFRAAPTAEAVADLERTLLRAGNGARSLVLPERLGPYRGRLLTAVNVRDRLRWFDHDTNMLVTAPEDGAGALRSIDFDPNGVPLGWAPGFHAHVSYGAGMFDGATALPVAPRPAPSGVREVPPARTGHSAGEPPPPAAGAAHGDGPEHPAGAFRSWTGAVKDEVRHLEEVLLRGGGTGSRSLVVSRAGPAEAYEVVHLRGGTVLWFDHTTGMRATPPRRGAFMSLDLDAEGTVLGVPGTLRFPRLAVGNPLTPVLDALAGADTVVRAG